MRIFDWALARFRKPPPPRTSLREGWFEALLDETRLLERWPGYASVLARMDPVAGNSVASMAVALRRWDDPGSRVQLLVNLEWLAANRAQATGVLLHEIQHVLLGHLTDPALHAVAAPRVMEIAMEISADEGVPIPLPEDGFSLAAFARYGIRARQSSMERYQLLLHAIERGELRMEDLWMPRTRDDHRPRQGGRSVGVGIGDLLDARSDRATPARWKNARWGLGAPSSAWEIERMKQKIALHLRGERGGEDDALGDTQRRIAKELDRMVYESPPNGRIDWPRTLREAFPRRRVVRPDHKRPNRRFPSRVGEIPGRTRRPPRPALLVAIDTSGSITGVLLDRIAQEVRRLSMFARLTIVECDAAVHRVYPFTGRLGPFVGGGDTDFAPVFEEARTLRGAVGVVYFTDGKGQLPADLQPIPTLWVITHDDPFFPGFGRVVRMPAA